MMYNSSGGILVQDKGKEVEYKFNAMNFDNKYSFDYNSNKFPICSKDFIVYALNPTYEQEDYTRQFQSFLIIPPMNSHSVKQRTINEEDDYEFFWHFDDKYVLLYQSDKIYIPTLKLLHLNGKEVQTIKFEANNQIKRPIFSQSGEFMLCAETIKLIDQDENSDTQFNIDVVFKVYKIGIGKDYGVEIEENKNNSYEDPCDQNKELFKLEPYHEFIVTNEFITQEEKRENSSFFDTIYDSSERKLVFHVDNEGNYLYLAPSKEMLLLNDKNVWEEFQNYWSKGKLGKIEDFETLKFGQGYLIIKVKEIIYQIYYDGVEKYLTSGKAIRHKALDLPGECDLEHIVPTCKSQYVNLFYKLGKSLTIVVWDLKKDIEHSNFSSREGDVFMDYITGKKSELGIVCFDKYIVDLDNGIPNPFVSKSIPSNEKYWCQGLKINLAEDMLLSLGTIDTPLSKIDIQYFEDKSNNYMDLNKVSYYLNKHSVAFDYLNDHEELSKVLKFFKS